MSKSKSTGALLVLGIAVVGLIGGTVLVRRRAETQSGAARRIADQERTYESTQPEGGSGTQPQEKVKFYQDEAGFTFSYLSSLVVTEEANQDEFTYSSLEIFSSLRPGEKMTIKVVDSEYLNVEDWLKKNREPDSLISETVLAGVNGKTVRTPRKTITVVIRDAIIVLLESPKDDQNFWPRHHQVIADSFKVNWPSNQSAGGSSGVEIEEEEVIE